MTQIINNQTPDAFIGDWVFLDQQIITTNLGAEIHFSVNQAKEIFIDWPSRATINNYNQTIAIKIDDQDFRSYFLDQQILKIELPDQQLHKIRIVIQGNIVAADYWFGEQNFSLNKIFVESGELIVEQNQQENIFFIGDSITAGAKIGSPFEGPQDNHPETSYPIQVSDFFGLNNIRIAYGGTGITPKASIYPPSAFEFIWKINSDTKRPLHYKQKNRAVVVNLGTNDTAASKQEFTWSLQTFLIELKKHFHQLPIYVMIPFNQQFADIFEAVVPKFDRIKLIETKDIQVSFADKLHPDQQGHDSIAKYLIEYFKQEF